MLSASHRTDRQAGGAASISVVRPLRKRGVQRLIIPRPDGRHNAGAVKGSVNLPLFREARTELPKHGVSIRNQMLDQLSPDPSHMEL